MSWVYLEQLLVLSRESLHMPWQFVITSPEQSKRMGVHGIGLKFPAPKFRFRDGISHIALQNLTLEARIGVSAAEQLSAHWKAETFSKILTSTAQRHLCNRPYSFKLTS